MQKSFKIFIAFIFCFCAAGLNAKDTGSISDLRFQKAGVYARYGEIFMDGGLRDYFLKNDADYKENMLKRWSAEVSQNRKQAKEGVFTNTELSKEDAAKVLEIGEKIKQAQKNNFILTDGVLTANPANIINIKNLDGEISKKLYENNMFIVKENKNQLFEIYTGNNYSNIPSFITTDLILQLASVYISYFNHIAKDKQIDVSFVNSYWDKCLLALSKTYESYPPFMKLTAWQIKNLNSSLSAQTSIKNSAYLNFLQKEPVEKPDGGIRKEDDSNPPYPYTVGYVEPNILFWQKTGEMFNAIVKVLEEKSLLHGDLRRKTDKLKDITEFLYETSCKELDGRALVKSDYERIAWLGSEIEAVTYFFIQKSKEKDSIAGAEFYAKEKNADLYNALGNADAVYVIAEIDGFLYLAKGAVFSYYEFSRPQNAKTNPLTAKEWQKTIKEGKAPQEPAWIKNYILKSQNPEF